MSLKWLWTLSLVFSLWRFTQAPASDVEVDQSTGLFGSSSNMFRMSMISLVGFLGVAISIGLAYHYVLFVPQRKKGKKTSDNKDNSSDYHKARIRSGVVISSFIHCLRTWEFKRIWEFRRSEEISLRKRSVKHWPGCISKPKRKNWGVPVTA